jgi:hypothetical protein
MNFETVCSTQPETTRKKSIKRKKQPPESEEPKKLPALKLLSRYDGCRARNMGLRKSSIK